MTEQATINALTCVASWGNHGLAGTTDRQLLPIQYQRRIGRPLCGDCIDIRQQTDEQWLVTKIHPRRSYFARADRFGRQQLIAANVDQALVVIAPEPAPSRDLIDRYLCANEILGISSVLVLNKIDLADGKLEQLRDDLSLYQQLGYKVIECSALDNTGIDELRQLLKGTSAKPACSLLIGQSGVGKSSLLNCLIPDLSVQTSSLSTATGKGKHTTTIAQQYALPEPNSTIIDSPGVWEYGLWVMPADELAASFIEFRQWLGRCRFHDCRHLSEPDCSLQQQADQSDLFASRLQCYRRILAEQERFNNH